MSQSQSQWTQVADTEINHWGQPGQRGWGVSAVLSRRADRWRCVVEEQRGSNQGCRYEVHESRETEGRGDSPNEAIEACRRDVFAWAPDDATRGEYATMLRQLLYDVEDNEFTERT